LSSIKFVLFEQVRMGWIVKTQTMYLL
jgi:hypothetical protein